MSEDEVNTLNYEPDIDYSTLPFLSIYDSAPLSINPGCSLPELVPTSHLNLLSKSIVAVQFTITYWSFTLKTGQSKQGYSCWLQSVHHLNDCCAHVADLQLIQTSSNSDTNREQSGPNLNCVVKRTPTRRRFLVLKDLDSV
jgi:hypothetical protein